MTDNIVCSSILNEKYKCGKKQQVDLSHKQYFLFEYSKWNNTNTNNKSSRVDLSRKWYLLFEYSKRNNTNTNEKEIQASIYLANDISCSSIPNKIIK